MLIPYKELLKMNGALVKFIFYGTLSCIGRISVHRPYVYICHNLSAYKGFTAKNLFGYKYSYQIASKHFYYSNFEILSVLDYTAYIGDIRNDS